MAASSLEENLRALHNSLTGSVSQKENAIGIVTDLNQVCVQELTDKDIDFTCSCLFNKEFGLVSFLGKAVTYDELQVCKARGLELLSEFIDKTGKKVLPYAVEIKDLCVSLFSRDRYARVKNAAMPALTRLLAQTVGSTMGKDLQIDKLITKFFNELTKGSKITATVKEKIYVLLGIIAEIYPEYMTQYSERLTGIYLGALKAEMNSKSRKPELSIISGCLEGLYCSLVHFTESSEDGSKNSYEIYKYARSAIDPKVEFSRYDVPKAGLQLFARHSSQFSQYLIEDYENLYGKMSYWSHHKNSELVKAGNGAIESFLTQIAEMLKEKAKEGKQEGGRIFKYFIRQFRDIIHNESASDKELSLAIKGYGLLAGPCRNFMNASDVKFMFVEMLTKTEQQFLGQSDTVETRIFSLSSYLESLASIVKEMEDLSETYALSLEHLLVLLMENIPNIHTDKHFLCRRAILWLLIAVMPKRTIFRQLLSGFVFQSLIRTCSHAPVVQTENEGEVSVEDFKVKVISYKDYMQLWSGLLDVAQLKEFAAAGISIEIRSQLTDILYSELVLAVLKILGKLDLSSAVDGPNNQGEHASVSEDKDELVVASADPLLGQQASKPKDHQIFINLVDFCRDLLPVKNYERFEEWMFTFTHKLIVMSSENPLASGFYKLLSVCMKIANKLNYFQDISGQVFSPSVKQETMETDSPQSVGQIQKYQCYLLITKFSQEVLVRMKQYRDELLASCLTLTLSLPKEVISEQMMDVVPAIQVTLSLGLSYLPLAVVALDALEFWSRSLPRHLLLPYYKDILPYLDNYLKTVDQGAEDVNVESNVSTTKTKSGKGRKKLSIRLIKGKKDKVTQSYQSQLTQVKQRIVRYLGQLGGSANYLLLSQADQEISRKAIAWDTMQHLKFDMPFVDMKPTIYLDPFLSHVSELAMTSSDRQTKVAACELLHSLILFAIGRGAQQPGAEVERSSMASIYKNIFHVMLKLACDVELVSKQLFEPLTMQVIHWFSGNKKSESDETIMLLDAIFDGTIQQSDTALRDFCAKCLHEFLYWSIKQTSAKVSETNPVNAKSVLKRLYSFSRHPSAFKRLGAALAFNNIYRVFREEEPLVNMFTFELLVHFVESLAIAHSDDKSLGTQEQCCKALEHLEKIIRHKAKLLSAPSKLRKEPRNWNVITLEIAVRWLTRQCGRPQTECRHACMKLSYQLCTMIPGIKSPVHFFQACLKGKGAGYWIQRFEGGGQTGKKKQGIEGFPCLTDTADVFSLPTILSWFDNLLAALDCYTWVFGENLLSAKELFGGAVNSQMFTSVGYFLQNVALKDIDGVAKLFPVKSETEYFTPREIERFNRCKCTVIVRLLGFLTVMLAKFKKETIAVVPKTIWESDLMKLICVCVIKPSDVGFNMGDVEIMKNLPQEMAQTLAVFSLTWKDNIVSNLKKILIDDRNLFESLPIPLEDSSTDHIHVHQMLSGYLQLQEVGLLLPALQGHSKEKSAFDLLNNVFQGIVSSGTVVTAVKLSPMAVATANALLKLAFSLGISDGKLVECLLDNTHIYSGSDTSTVQQHGDLFFSMFRGTISKHCVTRITSMVPLLVKHIETDSQRISTIFTSAVETVIKDKELRKREGPNVLNALLSSWSSMSVWWDKKASTDQQSMALLLITKLLLIDSKFASDQSQKSFDHVFSMYQAMLTDTRTNLSFKCRVLELLPFFAMVQESHVIKLKSSLDRFVADNFPLRSSELIKGSQKYSDYIAALDRILNALQLTGSHMLLEYLISIFCKEQNHMYEDAILTAITNFTKRLPRDKQKDAVDVPFKFFTKTGSFPSEIRRSTVEKVALPMLRSSSKSAFLEFYKTHISTIRDLIEVKLSKSSEGVLEGQLVSRLCCFQLLEMMYTRLSKDEVVGMSSEINKAFAGGDVKTGKELTQFVSVQAHAAKGEDCRGETILLELRRQYHCAAHNLMIAFISRTQTELKYYTAFLFEEKEAKGQFLFENLVDKNRNYEFPFELMSPIERKKRFVSIHQDMKDRMKEDEDSDEEVSPSVHLASQYLADSSLSEDVSQYFSMSGTAGSFSSQGSRRGKRTTRQPPSVEEEMDGQVTVEENYVELEMDELNKHECMAMMIALIKHMKKNKITPDVQQGTVNPSMPSWMDKLHTKMCNGRTHHNIKMFIGKLIINMAEVFEPYACHWLQPLCQLIIGGPLGSGSINYYIVDLLVTMLSWSKTAIPKDNVEEKAMTSRLVHFVVKNIYHENRPVFRNNLEMLKTLLECWKPRIDIPYQEIYGQFSNPDPKSKENIVGIQVMGVVLACKFPPYGPVAPVDRERFFSKIANNMNSTSKQIFAPTAEICGMIFQYLADKEDEKEGPFHTCINNLMNSLHQAKPDSFVICVHRMQKHYPTIADRFINKLLFMLPQVHGEFRTLCLEVLHSRIDHMENAFLELKSKGIVTALTHREEATQLISLKIVKSIVSKLKPSELSFLMSAIIAFNSNPSAACRIVMYEILMWVYDNYRDEESEESNKIISLTKETLLKGLCDEDLHCRLQVQNFWSSETRLPVGTLDRLVAMLEAMYSPVTEHQYLSYATNLLLEMTSKSPDYQREVFEHPLSECKFVDYSVKSSWRQRHAAMTPLFATQSQMEVDDTVEGIRATMDVQQFAATVEPGAHKGPYNWLTQSSLDTYSDTSMATMDTQTSTASSLLFTMGTSDTPVRSRPKPGPGFGKQRLTTPKPSTSTEKKEDVSDRSDLYKLKRRFVKDQEQSRIFFASRNIRLREMRERLKQNSLATKRKVCSMLKVSMTKQVMQEQKARRENQVTMYRKYRSGDLPDIQIKYSYIIAPLQALAHRDSTVAKLLFSAIFQAIFTKMEEVKTDREAGEALVQITTSIDSIMTQSTQYYSPFIGCVLDILYKLRSQLKVDVANVGGGSIFSKLQPLGIVVLEEQLIIHDPGADKRAAKKGRFETPVSDDIRHWIELSRLYKSVEEYDVLLGIFGGKIGTQSLTQKAVEAEARGDYAAAKKIYDEALECEDWPSGQPSEAEIDLWEDCRMECLFHLSQWEQLEEAAVGVIDSSDTSDLCKVWEDTFLQEHFLPYILTSKVKMMLQGDENQQSLLDFIDTSMKVPEHKLVLENRFSDELSLMYLWQEDYDRARHYNRMALDFFLQEWSSTDSLMLASRSSLLHKLQPLIETQEFLEFMEEEKNFQTMDPAQRLLKTWNNRTPHLLTDPVYIWDEVVTNRSVFMDQISGKLQNLANSQDSMEEEDIFMDTKLRLKLRMAEGCKEQNNFTLTLKILKETHSLCKRSDSPDIICEWTHLYASTHHKKSQTSLDGWTDDMFNSILTTIDQLGKIEETENLASSPALVRRHHVISGQARELLALGLQGFDPRHFEGKKAGQKLLELTGLKKLNKQELTEQLIQDGYKEMKASISTEGVDSAKGRARFGEEEAYLATAKYCDNILRQKEDENMKLGTSCVQQFPETVTVCLLKAIKLNSMEARQRFPRLLQIVELYPDTMATFIKKSKEVSPWQFLLWTSQMFAILDKKEAPAVHGILEEITSLYPQAVVYPFKLSQDGYSFGSSKSDKINESVVEKLNMLLGPDKLPITAKFMSALDCFSQPDQDFKELFEDIAKLIRKGEKSTVMLKYKELYWKLLDYKNREREEGKQGQSKTSQRSQSSRGSGQQHVDDDDDQSVWMSDSILDIGSYARKFADKFKKEFDDKLGPEGKKLQDMSLKEFSSVKSKLLKLCSNEIKKTLKPPMKLSEYSKWMSDFSPSTHGRSLEMPGQYTGLNKPLPEYHVHVSGFDQRVMVMTSIRKPKRITIRGNDEKDYHFLVKGGEDLRQDQRIEQLFYIMNQVFNKDPVCRNRKLALKTYQVIPMTTRVGLIEWMSNTKPLKDFLRESYTKQEEQFINSKQGPIAVQQVWIGKHSKEEEDNPGIIYANVYKNYSYTETERQLNIVQSKIPWDLSRRAFEKMSTSPEAYHVLRSQCAKTHAMICICQYILGIGDRHLSNFMVNLKTGEMVGIDFGHAFGSATQFIPVPELMPFRLTRQIRNLMLPLGVKGLMENTMIHVLQALRSDSDLLLNTMDIFVKEPSLDWLQNAERQMGAMRDEDVDLYMQEGEEKEWYPKEKINYVKRKLKGVNPAYITRDELKLGHGKKTSFKDFERVALGDKRIHTRAQLPESGLTVEQQISALIDQASDPNILGRTWVGWEPWV